MWNGVLNSVGGHSVANGASLLIWASGWMKEIVSRENPRRRQIPTLTTKDENSLKIEPPDCMDAGGRALTVGPWRGRREQLPKARQEALSNVCH